MDNHLENSVINSEETETAISKSKAEAETKEKISVEEFTISGDALVDKIKALIHQGNVRRIIIKNKTGQILMEIPMAVGVIGGLISAAFFPEIIAIGVIGAIIAHLTVVIERQESGASHNHNQD